MHTTAIDLNNLFFPCLNELVKTLIINPEEIIMKNVLKLISLSTVILLAPVTESLAANAPMQQSSEYLSEQHALSTASDMQLRQIIARLNHSIDLGDYKSYASFFADDGVFDTAFGKAVGPEQVEAALEQSRPYISGKRHVASTMVISGDDKKAKVTSYLTVYEATTSLAYLGSAVNTDDFEYRDGEWVITRHSTYMDPATIAAMQK